jgi:hypothetical protein
MRLHKSLNASAVLVPSTYQPLCVTEGRTHMHFSTATKQLHLSHTVLQVPPLNKPPWVSHTACFSAHQVCALHDTAQRRATWQLRLLACCLCAAQAPAGTVHKAQVMPSCPDDHTASTPHNPPRPCARTHAKPPPFQVSKACTFVVCRADRQYTVLLCCPCHVPSWMHERDTLTHGTRAWWEHRGRMRNTTPQAAQQSIVVGALLEHAVPVLS